MRKVIVKILDDDPERAVGWSEQVNALKVDGLDAAAAPLDETEKLVDSLRKRRVEARKLGKWRSISCTLDQTNILLVDYDLLLLDESTTGEEVAYLARAFSSAGLIVVVNQFGTNSFDLTLQEDLRSKDDLDIGSEQIANPGLWSSGGPSGYRPWHWPVLPDETSRLEQRVQAIAVKLDAPLLPVLGFGLEGQNPTRQLTRDHLSFLNAGPKSPTFRDVACGTEYGYVHAKDREALLRDDAQVARVAAAVVWKWLERWVLPHHTVLSDLPHLVSRMPWLLEKTDSVEDWNRSADLSGSSVGVRETVGKYRFKPTCWFSRPVYWAQELANDPELGKPAKGWRFDQAPDFVFREDTADFGPRSASLEFQTPFKSLYDRHYVCDPAALPSVSSVKYSPQTLLAE